MGRVAGDRRVRGVRVIAAVCVALALGAGGAAPVGVVACGSSSPGDTSPPGGAALPAGPSPPGGPSSPPDPSSLDVTRFGAVGDGVADDTAAFRAAAATGKAVFVPKPTAHYRLSGTVRLRASLAGVDLPEIRMYGADGSRAGTMFEIVDHKGPSLVVKGIHLNGQWDGSTRGEHSHAISVRGSTGVVIEDNVLERPYGDGVYIGGGGNPRPSVDVVIRGNRIVDPMRCAIAVISGENVLIQRNRIQKTTPYVAAIDLEPNPHDPDRIDGVVITENEFDVPGGIAVLLYSWKDNPNVNRNVTITSNTARARQFLENPDGTGSWELLRVANNTFEGDPNGPRFERVSFAKIEKGSPRAPHVVSDVVVEANTIAVKLRAGQTYRDSFRGVRGLVIRGNRWIRPAKPHFMVVDSPGAVVE
jgi:hypothetical protein